MNPRILSLCIACALIGYGAGYLSGPSGRTAPSASSEAAVEVPHLGSPSLGSFEAALKDTNLLTRSRAYSEFLLTLSPETLGEALAILTAHLREASEQDLRLFMLAWTRFDAPGAFEWARSHELPQSTKLSQAAMFAWGYRDPQAAVAKLEEIGEEPRGSALYAQAIRAWSQNGDVEGLSEHIITMPKTHERVLAAAALANWIARDGIDALIEWVEAVPDDSPEAFKQVAFHEAMSTIARRDPERALAWFNEHQGHKYAARTLEMIARRWVDYHDAEQVIPRLRALPESKDRKKAIEVAMRWWLRKSPEQAAGWLEGLETWPSDLDPAIAAMARHLAQKSPRQATIWAARINDEELRAKALQRYGRQWRARNPEQLQVWLASAKLSPGEKESILSGPTLQRRPSKAKKRHPPRPH